MPGLTESDYRARVALRRKGERAYVPTRPTFIPPVPGAPIAFSDVAGLAAHVQGLRRGAGLALRSIFAARPGSLTFPAIRIDRLVDDEPEYVGVAYVNGMSREAFEDALRDAETPAAASSRRLSRHQPADLLVIEQ